MGFDYALKFLKSGEKLTRKGWNGKGLNVKLIESGDELLKNMQPFFVIKNAEGIVNTWVPSVSDILADDWGLVYE